MILCEANPVPNLKKPGNGGAPQHNFFLTIMKIMLSST